MTNWTEEDVERAALAWAFADGCGLTINGARVLCDHPEAKAKVEICGCRLNMRAALSALPRPSPSREAVIEECARAVMAFKRRPVRLYEVAHAIRSLSTWEGK